MITYVTRPGLYAYMPLLLICDISEDLLELCKADRVVLTGHCVDPAQLPTSHAVFQNTSESMNALMTSTGEFAAAITAAQIEGESKVGGASKVMHPTPPSHPPQLGQQRWQKWRQIMLEITTEAASF